MNTYIVAATGGLETPHFQCTTDKSLADYWYEQACKDLLSRTGDRVDLIHYDGETTVVLAYECFDALDNDGIL